MCPPEFRLCVEAVQFGLSVLAAYYGRIQAGIGRRRRYDYDELVLRIMFLEGQLKALRKGQLTGEETPQAGRVEVATLDQVLRFAPPFDPNKVKKILLVLLIVLLRLLQVARKICGCSPRRMVIWTSEYQLGNRTISATGCGWA